MPLNKETLKPKPSLEENSYDIFYPVTGGEMSGSESERNSA